MRLLSETSEEVETDSFLTEERESSPLAERRSKQKPSGRQSLRDRMSQHDSEETVSLPEKKTEKSTPVRPSRRKKPKEVEDSARGVTEEKPPSAVEQVILDGMYLVITSLICYLLVIWFYNSSSLLVL